MAADPNHVISEGRALSSSFAGRSESESCLKSCLSWVGKHKWRILTGLACTAGLVALAILLWPASAAIGAAALSSVYKIAIFKLGVIAAAATCYLVYRYTTEDSWRDQDLSSWLDHYKAKSSLN